MNPGGHDNDNERNGGDSEEREGILRKAGANPRSAKKAKYKINRNPHRIETKRSKVAFVPVPGMPQLPPGAFSPAMKSENARVPPVNPPKANTPIKKQVSKKDDPLEKNKAFLQHPHGAWKYNFECGLYFDNSIAHSLKIY